MLKRETDKPAENALLDKGFELACFIARDRASAIEILIGAIDKLTAQCRRESRRSYWRYNRTCQRIRRITHEELDAFQWLIMLESEGCERAQEQTGSPSLRDMVVRYVKHLVQVSTSMSSFYACVGINRLLYSYSTAETQTAFELVTQRFPEADQYRRAKKMLTSRLSQRFGGRLETIRTQNGEIRFKTLEDQSGWQQLVNDCLSMFSPWSTSGWCKYFASSMCGMSQTVPTAEDATAGPDTRETIYCHVFIEPVCRNKLSAALSLSSPDTKLALPGFLVKEETLASHGVEEHGSRAAKLSEEERALIAARLNASREHA